MYARISSNNLAFNNKKILTLDSSGFVYIHIQVVKKTK